MSKIKIEDIREELSTVGWKLISEKYDNLDAQMEFECNEGHRVFAPYKKIRNKIECPVCKQNHLTNTEGKVIGKKKGVKRYLALDQATHTSGYAIYDGVGLVTYGTFTTSLSDETARDNAIKNWLISMINTWKPDYIGLEGIQLQEGVAGGPKMGVTTFQALARLQGVLMDTCYEMKIPFEICATNTWRNKCGVKGRTRPDRKRSMQNLAKQWYDVTLSEDEADAVGIGYYLSNKINKNLEIQDWS